jgi:hypothetical protein
MDASSTGVQAYVCPMHADVRGAAGGVCPKCGMPLVLQGARFALLRHMTGSPKHLILMALLMLAVMAAAMMLFSEGI